MNLDTIRQLSSVLVERFKFARRAGVTYEGKRDVYTVLGYKKELTFEDYRERYERNDVAGRVVEAYPLDTWRGGAELQDDPDPTKESEFEKSFRELAERLKLWSVLKRADVLAGIGTYSVVLIGAPGSVGQPLRKFRPDQLRYLRIYAEDEAKIHDWERDGSSERYGQPTFYRLRRNQTATTSLPQGPEKIVHHSRIIHVSDGLLDDEIFGTPRLRRVWNRLDDLEKVVGGGSEAFWLRAHQGYHFNLDKDFRWPAGTAGDQAKEAMDDEVEEFMMGMSRALRTKGMEVDTLGSDVADFSPQASSILTLISLATGIPKRILEGSERGELSSNQDKTTWEQRIGDRRKDFAVPHVIDPLVKRLIEHGALPEPKNKRYEAIWGKAQDLDESTRAKLGNQWASINKQMQETVVTRNELRVHVLNLPPIEEVVNEAELKKMDEKFKKPEPKTGPDPDAKGEGEDGTPKEKDETKVPDGTSAR